MSSYASCFSFSLFLQNSKYVTPIQEFSNKKLSVQEYERDRIERELQKWTNKSLSTDPHKPFY